MEAKPRESMGLCVAMLRIGGLWHTRDMSHGNAILYNMWKTLTVGAFCVLTLQVYLYLLIMWGTSEDMFETIAYSITMTVFVLKIRLMLFKKEDVNDIVQTVQENFIIHGNELSTENTQIIKNTIKLGRKVTIAYAVMLTTSIALFILPAPLISLEVPLQMLNTANISSEARISDRRLPFVVWFPVNVTQSPMFETAYIYLSTAGAINSYNMISLEVFCMTTVIYTAGQFELLGDSIRNASQRVKYRLNGVQRSSDGTDNIDELQKFTSVKNKMIQHSDANTESTVTPAIGKVTVTYSRIPMTSKHFCPSATIFVKFSGYVNEAMRKFFSIYIPDIF
jgi:hypothetical protein